MISVIVIIADDHRYANSTRREDIQWFEYEAVFYKTRRERSRDLLGNCHLPLVLLFLNLVGLYMLQVLFVVSVLSWSPFQSPPPTLSFDIYQQV